MRELIESRMTEIRENNRGFQKSTMRWKNFDVVITDEVEETSDTYHVSEIHWGWLSDEELLDLYERLIRRLSKVM